MNALVHIAQHLVAAVRPLETALESPASFRAFMLRLGWRTSEIPPAWSELASYVSSLESSVASLADDPTLDEVLSAVFALKDLRDHLGTLSAAPPGIDRDVLVAELRDVLLEHLVIDELARNAPRTYGLLQAFGLITADFIAATPDRPARKRYHFDTDKLAALIRDPSALPQLVYNWGNASFDPGWVTNVLFELLVRLGVRPVLERTPGTFPGYPQVPIGERVIRVSILDLVRAGAPFRLGVGIAVLPAESGGPGIVIAPRVPGLTDGALELGPRIALKTTAANGSPIDFALVVSPQGLRIEFPGSGGALPDGGLGIEAAITAPGRFGSATGSRFEVGGVTVGLYADHDDDGYFARVAARVDGAKIVIAASDQDGVIATLLSAREVTAAFPLGIQWSSRHGFALTLGPGTLGVPGSLTLGPVRLDNIGAALAAGDHDISATATARVTTTLGPLAIVLDRIGGKLSLDRSTPGSLGLGALDAGVALPTSAEIVFETKAMTGGGEIQRDPATGRYAGAIELAMFRYRIVGAAILDTHTPEGRSLLSFVALAAVQFGGIPLVMGFILDGLGGVIGLHRRADDERMRTALRAGKLADLLLPDDPKVGLPNLLAQLGELFPIAEGRFVAGPSIRIGWGTPRSLTADVLVLLEGPSPLRILVLASGALGLPTLEKRIVDVRIDALGVLDLDRGTLAIDASLHDSTIAGCALSGDLALRANLKSPRALAFAIGGFHPRFTPPAGFPALRRVELITGDNPQLRMSAYLARTPNSVQVGATVDLKAHGGNFEIKAHLGFDALFELHPFHFDIDIKATADVSWRGHHLIGLDLTFNLTGPHPYHAKGHASFSILWWDVSVGFDHTWGDDSSEQLPPAPDLARVLRDAFAADDAWVPELHPSESTWVALRGEQRALHPFASVVVVERALPLEYDITMYSSLPTSVQRFAITGASIIAGNTTTPLSTTPVSESFAPGQFTKMSQDDQLTAPSFESFPAGVRLGDDAIRSGPTSHSPLAFDTIEIDDLAPPPPTTTHPSSPVAGTFAAFAAAVRRRSGIESAPTTAPRLRDLAFSLASKQTLATTGATGTYAQMREALRATASTELQVVVKAHAS